MIKPILHLFLLLFLLFIPCLSTTKYICNPQDSCGCSAQPNSWNWLVSLHDSNGHFCDGSILNEFYVITAAHCLQKTADALSDISIYLGREHHAIDSFIRSSAYNEETFENDIALIRVRTPFNFTDRRIARICLPDEHLEIKTDVIAVSWTKYETGDTTNNLQQMRMQIANQSMDRCGSIAINNQTQFCATTLKNGKHFRFVALDRFIRSLLSFDRLLSK